MDALMSDEPDEDYILDLRKDVIIIDGMAGRVVEIVQPTLYDYDVRISETLEKTVTVEATSWEEAKAIAESAWKNGDYILDADNFTGVNFLLERRTKHDKN